MTTNRPKDALLELEKARPLDQRAADVMYLRGRAYLQAGMLREAERSFASCSHLSIEPNAGLR